MSRGGAMAAIAEFGKGEKVEKVEEREGEGIDKVAYVEFFL